MKLIPRSFYLRPTLDVAKDLLGKNFIRRIGDNLLVGRIVEVEAYCSHDPASHSFNGVTPRNEVMFWEGGHAYVYFTYGMHFCVNVVTAEEGKGEAVLIRAVEPMTGIEVMLKNRFPHLRTVTQQSLINLTNGPAKLCQAFHITRLDNGEDLLEGSIAITGTENISKKLIGRSHRIGIKQAIDRKWRFYIKDNPWVSQ